MEKKEGKRNEKKRMKGKKEYKYQDKMEREQNS